MELKESHYSLFNKRLPGLVHNALWGGLELVTDNVPVLTRCGDEENYSARSDINLFRGEDYVGKGVVILFKEGDATGDDGRKPYDVSDVSLPHSLVHPKYLPRAKDDVLVEGAFGLGTWRFTGVSDYVSFEDTSLAILTLDDRMTLSVGGYVGRLFDTFHKKKSRIYHPKMYMTVGFDDDGNRVFDPHTVANFVQGTAQLALFVGAEKEGTLCDIIRERAILNRQKD